MPLALQYVPNGQSKQLLEPVEGAYEPGGHKMCRDAPALLQKLPAGHWEGKRAADEGQNAPTGHWAQTEIPLATSVV